MSAWQVVILVLFSFAGGASALSATITYYEQINDWRPDALGTVLSMAIVAAAGILPWA